MEKEEKLELLKQTALQIRSMLQGFEKDEVVFIMSEALRGENVLVPIQLIGLITKSAGGRKAVITLSKEGDINFTIKAGNGESLKLNNK